jgi:hypothetical protein
MPRCPLCRSALVTITFGLYPIASCGALDPRRPPATGNQPDPRSHTHGPQPLLARPIETSTVRPPQVTDGHILARQELGSHVGLRSER